MATKVWVTEEYGYREWLWVHPGTADDVVVAWQARRCPVTFWGLRAAGEYDGTCEEWDPREAPNQALEDTFAAHRAACPVCIEAGDSPHMHMPFGERPSAECPEALALCKAYLARAAPDVLCTKHGVEVVAHVHEEDDSGLRVLATGAWHGAPDVES